MSDYLSNLIQRTLTPTGAVRPRLAGLFEPQVLSASPATESGAAPFMPDLTATPETAGSEEVTGNATQPPLREQAASALAAPHPAHWGSVPAGQPAFRLGAPDTLPTDGAFLAGVQIPTAPSEPAAHPANLRTMEAPRLDASVLPPGALSDHSENSALARPTSTALAARLPAWVGDAEADLSSFPEPAAGVLAPLPTDRGPFAERASGTPSPPFAADRPLLGASPTPPVALDVGADPDVPADPLSPLVLSGTPWPFQAANAPGEQRSGRSPRPTPTETTPPDAGPPISTTTHNPFIGSLRPGPTLAALGSSPGSGLGGLVHTGGQGDHGALVAPPRPAGPAFPNALVTGSNRGTDGGRGATQPPPPPAPTIQVTIGRVEVRGTSAQASMRLSPGPPPRLSLVDYLRQREGHVK